MICEKCKQTITAESLRADVIMVAERARIEKDANGIVYADTSDVATHSEDYGNIYHDCGAIFVEKWALNELCNDADDTCAHVKQEGRRK